MLTLLKTDFASASSYKNDKLNSFHNKILDVLIETRDNFKKYIAFSVFQ